MQDVLLGQRDAQEPAAWGIQQPGALPQVHAAAFTQGQCI